MKIHGINKLTLLDYPEHTACTIFSGGCNFRCPFCQNSDLVISPKLTPSIPEEDIFAFLSKRKGLLDGICISGGEPLLQEDLSDFIKQCKDRGLLVKLDTNGFLYERLQRLINEGLLDYIAMDIKAAPENYAKFVGIPKFDPEPVLRSFEKNLNELNKKNPLP